MLTITYALTKEDYINYYLFVTWDAPGKQKKRSLYYLKQTGTIILFTALFYYTGLFNRSSLFSFIVIGFIVLTCIVSITGVRLTIINQAKAITNDPGNNSIFITNTVTISGNGILLQDKFTERKFQWQAFNKKLENKHYYFLFYNSLEAIIIPKNVFHQPDDKLLFDGLLTQFLSFDAEVGHLINDL